MTRIERMEYIDASDPDLDQDAIRAYHLLNSKVSISSNLLIAAVRAAIDVLNVPDHGHDRAGAIGCTAVRICQAVGELDALRQQEKHAEGSFEDEVECTDVTPGASTEGASRTAEHRS